MIIGESLTWIYLLYWTSLISNIFKNFGMKRNKGMMLDILLSLGLRFDSKNYQPVKKTNNASSNFYRRALSKGAVKAWRAKQRVRMEGSLCEFWSILQQMHSFELFNYVSFPGTLITLAYNMKLHPSWGFRNNIENLVIPKSCWPLKQNIKWKEKG